jgi:hypothetical protein
VAERNPRLPPDPLVDLAERRRQERLAVDEAGGGQAEGFELSEQELIQHASHGDESTPSRILLDAERSQEEPEAGGVVYGQPDEESPPD